MDKGYIEHPAGEIVHRFTPGLTEYWSEYGGVWHVCGCTRKNIRDDGTPVVSFASTWAEPVETV